MNNKSIQYYIKTFPDQIQDQIDEIMDNFDFEKVAKTMKFLEWGWATEGWKTEIPDIYRIKKSARERLKEVTFKQLEKADKEEAYTFTGGFEATCTLCEYPEDYKPEGWEDNAKCQIVLTLKFIIEEWNTSF